MKIRFVAGCAVLGLTAVLCACSSSFDDSKSADGPQEVTMWMMKDSVTDDYLARFKKDFTAAHRNITLDVQVQEWDGIGERITAALAGNDAPDVIEVGNTQVAQYASSGGVKDLSDKKADLRGDNWLPGLAEPGRIDGRQFGIPWYAANRVVIYRKDHFAKAGIKTPPKTREEWIATTRKLNSGGNQGIYLPGQTWYTLAGFIWDEGGDLAVKDGENYRGALDTPEALRGMAFYQELQALGKGPKDSDEAKPNLADVVSKGDVSQYLAVPGNVKLVEQANPGLQGKFGYFPVPGRTAGKPGASFTGGSDLIIPEASQHQDAAYEVIKALTGDTWQKDMAKTMSYVPNRTTLADSLRGDEGMEAMAAAAANGRATPNSPEWAAVEATNPIKGYMTAVLTGKDPAAEAKKASDSITRTLTK